MIITKKIQNAIAVTSHSYSFNYFNLDILNNYYFKKRYYKFFLSKVFNIVVPNFDNLEKIDFIHYNLKLLFETEFII